ncbi:MAG: hypothetical protein HY235_18635 [Acidobacteria bacterium]|nr:hypothetical protein [Acidobacteriota bacterium]
MIPGMRHWLAFGMGAGIEVSAGALRVAIVRVRPSGADLLDTLVIEEFLERPAAEWGAEYAAFLRRHAAGHLAATVLLPRREIIVRLVALPGVARKDLEAALRLQIDSLHPHSEGEGAWTWARLGKSPAVLVAIARLAYIERMAERFAEAGIKVAAFTFSASLIYSALRLLGTPPAQGFLGLMETEAGVEAYGESPARAVYSATYDQPWERAAVLAAGELRLGEEVSPRELTALLPSPRRARADAVLAPGFAMAYLAALAAACPRLALPANLLPAAQRSTSSRVIYAPTLALGLLLLLGLGVFGLYGRYEDQRYLKALESEIAQLEPRARMVAQLDQRIEKARARIRLLDQMQSRTKAGLDALAEATRLIAPPAWLNTLELTPTTLLVAGEADQAAGLLKAIDSSPLFQNSEFMVPLTRVGNVEIFRLRAAREGAVP